MSTKKHSFGQRLMINSLIEDAVLNDMMLINGIVSMERQEAIHSLSETLNLDEDCCKTIINKKLSVALFEASSIVNENATSPEEIKSLGQFCMTDTGKEAVDRIIKKYITLIEIFARKGFATSNPILFDSLKFSRRTSRALQDLLSEQIEESYKNLPRSHFDLGVNVGRIRLENLDLVFDKISSKLDRLSPYVHAEAVMEVSDECGFEIKKISPEKIKEIFNLTNLYIQGTKR